MEKTHDTEKNKIKGLFCLLFLRIVFQYIDNTILVLSENCCCCLNLVFSYLLFFKVKKPESENMFSCFAFLFMFFKIVFS